MATHSRSSLVDFYIFNTEFGQHEGEEEEKIMLFLPHETHIDEKIKRIGLSEALVQFASTFKPCHPCEYLHTLKNRQVFMNMEGNFWCVMTLSVPYTEKTNKEGIKTIDYNDEDIQNSIMKSVLHQSYNMFKLFNGSFTYIREKHGVEALKERLTYFYSRYLQTLNFGQFDILDVYHGISFLPLDKKTFLKVQSVVNMVLTNFKHICYASLLYNDQLIWTALNKSRMRILYKYLVTSLFPAAAESENLDKEQVKTSSKRNSGRFLTVPMDVLSSQLGNTKRAPRVFIEEDGEIKEMHLTVFKTSSVSLCLFLDAKQQLNVEYFQHLSSALGIQLEMVSSIVHEQIGKKALANVTDHQYRYVYFNGINLAVKSSIHAKKSSQTGVSLEMMRLLVDMHQDFQEVDKDCEFIVKTISDCWVVGRRSDNREFFVVLNQKNANLVEIHDEVKKLISGAFNSLFLTD